MEEARLLTDEDGRGCEHAETVLTLRRKLMEEASLKYLVGQEISPMRKPNMTAGRSSGYRRRSRQNFQQRQRFKQGAGKSTEAGVVLGELGAEKEILECGEEAVGDVFVERHSRL